MRHIAYKAITNDNQQEDIYTSIPDNHEIYIFLV